MVLRIIASIAAVQKLAEGVWRGDLRGAALPPKAASFRRELPTILFVQDGLFDPERSELSFDFGQMELLNRGNDAHALILSQADDSSTRPIDVPEGDQAFLSLLDSLSPKIRQAGRDLLQRIRGLDPHGELELRGRRFINRPDNFVALEPQTTLNQIIVHVRGLISTPLPSVATQRGYTAFKVSGRGDLLDAGAALGQAKRRF